MSHLKNHTAQRCKKTNRPIDILLINPPHRLKRHLFRFDVYSMFTIMPPLGLAYLASSCKASGYTADIIDMEAETLSKKELLKIIEAAEPALIGITCLSSLVDSVKELSGFIKNHLNTPIVVGGAHAWIDPEDLIKHWSIDYVLTGEGERTIVSLLDFLTKQRCPVKKISNLFYKNDGTIAHNNFEGETENIDLYPFPDRALLNNRSYLIPSLANGLHTSILSSRGCPFKCTFCAQQFKRFRRRSVESVIDEIKEITELYDTRNIQFFDETFNFPQQWVMEFCAEIIKQRIRINFRIRARPDLITDEMAMNLRTAGCYMVSLGIESANNRTLEFLRKGYTIEDVQHAITSMKKYALPIHGYFILGVPIESKREMEKTVEFARESKIDFATFSILAPYPRTDFYREAVEKGWYVENRNQNRDWIGVDKPLLDHPYLTLSQIKKLYRNAYLTFYLDHTRIWRVIRAFFYNFRVILRILNKTMANFYLSIVEYH